MTTKIINGVVYRDKEKLIFVSLYDEKSTVITDPQYFKLYKGRPIPEECFVLVFHEIVHHQLVTHPIAMIDIYIPGPNDTELQFKAKNITLDGLIGAVYEAAKEHLKSAASH